MAVACEEFSSIARSARRHAAFLAGGRGHKQIALGLHGTFHQLPVIGVILDVENGVRHSRFSFVRCFVLQHFNDLLGKGRRVHGKVIQGDPERSIGAAQVGFRDVFAERRVLNGVSVPGCRQRLPADLPRGRRRDRARERVERAPARR